MFASVNPSVPSFALLPFRVLRSRSQLPRPVDLVFLDHSKALYLEEIHRLEDSFDAACGECRRLADSRELDGIL